MIKNYQFLDIVTDITSKFKKVKKKDYLSEGQIRIIDQGQEQIAGYSDDVSLVKPELSPVIIFGDHTKVFKYEKNPLILGADGTKALRVNTMIAHDLYIYYFLKTISFQDAGYSRYFKFLKKIKIPIPVDSDGKPKIEDQTRIATLLSKVESLIAKRKKSIADLDELLKSTFLEMFGSFSDNKNGYSFEKLDIFITHITSGGRGWAKYYSESGKRFIRSLDVQMNKIGDDDVAYVNPPKNKEAKRTKIKSGDVLLTITGSKIGRVCFVPKGFEEAYISQHVAIIRTKGINSVYLSYYLSMPNSGQLIIQRKQYGQAKPGLNLDQIKNFEILNAPPAAQDKFATIVEKVESLKAKYQNSLNDLETLYGALSQKAFKGELDLSRIPITVELKPKDITTGVPQVGEPVLTSSRQTG
jgi:type I restriction enzyme S subunit